MGIQIISHKKRKDKSTYSLVYVWKEDHSAGFDFPCDENGELLLDKMAQYELNDYGRCEMGEWKDLVVFKGICKTHHIEDISAVARCHCGQLLALKENRNVCSNCGKSYNSIGEEL